MPTPISFSLNILGMAFSNTTSSDEDNSNTMTFLDDQSKIFWELSPLLAVLGIAFLMAIEQKMSLKWQRKESPSTKVIPDIYQQIFPPSPLNPRTTI